MEEPEIESPTFFGFIKFTLWLLFTKEGRATRKKYIKQQNCKHEKWYMDKQIRTIECCECGKQAWVEDFKDLYNH